MAKKKPKLAKKPKTVKSAPRPKARVIHRITTHGRGKETTTREVLPEPEPIALGPVSIPAGDEAVAVLRKLAELNDRAMAAHKAYLDSAATTKARKQRWDELAEEVQTLIRQSTHESEKPLLNMMTREQDTQAMETAAAAPASSGPAPGF